MYGIFTYIYQSHWVSGIVTLVFRGRNSSSKNQAQLYQNAKAGSPHVNCPPRVKNCRCAFFFKGVAWPIPSMGRTLYLPIFWLIFMVNVGTHTSSHGCYGSWIFFFASLGSCWSWVAMFLGVFTPERLKPKNHPIEKEHHQKTHPTVVEKMRVVSNYHIEHFGSGTGWLYRTEYCWLIPDHILFARKQGIIGGGKERLEQHLLPCKKHIPVDVHQDTDHCDH